MKTTEQISQDCGLTEGDIKSALEWPAFPDSSPNETALAKTASALYRRIEELEDSKHFLEEVAEKLGKSLNMSVENHLRTNDELRRLKQGWVEEEKHYRYEISKLKDEKAVLETNLAQAGGLF